jgi:SAM-dependent methyltransferase
MWERIRGIMVDKELYNNMFYQSHMVWIKRYNEIANWLVTTFNPKKVIDFGCGNGFIISKLKEQGVSVIGVDGSASAVENAAQNVKKNIQVADVSKSLLLGKYDLVISSEVAEHLAKESADIFVSNLASHSISIIFFTAAEPGQGGVNHINEQPHEYWIKKFNQNGFIFLKEESLSFRRYLRKTWKQYADCPKWFMWNSMIFRKATGEEAQILTKQFFRSKRDLKLHSYLARYLAQGRVKTFLRVMWHSLISLKS